VAAASRASDVHFESSSVGGITLWSFMMSKDKEPISPILVPFQQDLQTNRRGERTQQSYVRNDRKFAADKRQMLANAGKAGDAGRCWEMLGDAGRCWEMLGTLLFAALPTHRWRGMFLGLESAQIRVQEAVRTQADLGDTAV
jgi:hypothetical protein